MNKKLMRFAALLLAAAMLFSFSACRTNDDGSESSTDELSVTDAGNIHEESTDSAELTTDEPTTESRTATRSNVSGGTKTETVNVYKGLNSTNTSRVLKYYKAAAANTKSIDATQYMSMKRVDYTPRNSFQKGMLSLFTGIASAALAANSKAVTIIPGKYKQIKASDLISANAVAYGNYTIVTLNVRMQQDDQNTKDARTRVRSAGLSERSGTLTECLKPCRASRWIAQRAASRSSMMTARSLSRLTTAAAR